VRVISNAARSADMLIGCESRDGLSGQNRSDALLRMGPEARPTHVDVTVSSPWNVKLSATQQAMGAEAAPAVAAERKLRLYQHNLTSPSEFHFVPLAVSAAGVWESKALKWLTQDFATELEHRKGGLRADHAAELMINLSVALWRQNSRMLRWTPAHDSDPLDDSGRTWAQHRIARVIHKQANTMPPKSAPTAQPTLLSTPVAPPTSPSSAALPAVPVVAPVPVAPLPSPAVALQASPLSQLVAPLAAEGAPAPAPTAASRAVSTFAATPVATVEPGSPEARGSSASNGCPLGAALGH